MFILISGLVVVWFCSSVCTSFSTGWERLQELSWNQKKQGNGEERVRQLQRRKGEIAMLVCSKDVIWVYSWRK